MGIMRKATTKVGMAAVVAIAGVAVGDATASADGHQVTYTVTTTSDLNTNIQYIEVDPPSKEAYDADPARYLRQVRTPITGGTPLVYTATLADPSQWAFLEASGGLRINPEFHCELAIDGQVVVSQQGGSGVRCATQEW